MKTTRRKQTEKGFWDDPFIAFVRQQRCAVCNVSPCDPDHFRTRGAHGWNSWVWPLCRKHHVEKGNKGLRAFELIYGVSAVGKWRELMQEFEKANGHSKRS